MKLPEGFKLPACVDDASIEAIVRYCARFASEFNGREYFDPRAAIEREILAEFGLEKK